MLEKLEGDSGIVQKMPGKMAVYASIGLLQFAKVQPGFAKWFPGFAIRLLKASIRLLIAFSRLPGLHATFPDQILPF